MVHGEPEDLRACCTLCDVILLVAGDACHGESLCIAERCLALAVDDIVYRSAVVSVEDADVKDVLSEESLFAYLRNDIFTIIMDHDDLRKV